MFNTLDRQTYENTIVFPKAIDELTFLEQYGIEIDSSEGKKQIFLKLVSVLGDNLGLYSMFGLVESFNANFFCRFCYTLRSSMNNVFYESDCHMKTQESYEDDSLKKTADKQE